MPKTLRLLGTDGTTFANAFASYPLCCPSRATFLTGQYSHNHKVEQNTPPLGGYGKLDNSNTLPLWLQSAGYHTAHIGKYLNGYGRDDQTEVPAGWSDWQGLVDPSTYYMYGYTVNDNGTLTAYGHAESDYQTDVLGNRAVDVIRERADEDSPFFLSIAPLAPHAEQPWLQPPRPAPRHRGLFADEPLPRPPSFDEEDVSDKPSFVRNKARLSDEQEQRISSSYRARLETLLAVDDLVERVVQTLADTGELTNTVVFYTSDNGFFHGEHRVSTEKYWAYEESVRAPLLVRGGAFPAGATTQALVTNVDLAATIVDLAGAPTGRVLDGRSLLPLAREGGGEERAVLLETRSISGPWYQAVRTAGHLYVEYSNGERELYDMRRDPHQLTSLHADPAHDGTEAALKSRLDELRLCSGSRCG